MTDIPKSASGRTALEVARAAASRAGEFLVQRFSEVKEISYKAPGDIVTDVDTGAEAMIREDIAREFPGMGFLGEESAAGLRADQGYVWIVDPVDGTRNYAWGLPFFSIVVALALEGEVLVGVNHDPWRGEMFYAQRGQGAYLNGEPIHVSSRAALAECVIGMDLSYNDDGAVRGLNLLASLWPGMYTARVMGSSALGLSYAAAGRYDLYFHSRLSPWDQAAGLLLVEEAGGLVTDRTGQRAGLYSDGIIASSQGLLAEFMRRTEGSPWREPTHRMA